MSKYSKIKLFSFLFLFSMLILVIFLGKNIQASSSYNFSAKSGTTSGTITINWTDNGNANMYDVVYGASPDQLFWGSANMPFSKNGSNAFTISGLNPGQTYYVELKADTNASTPDISGPIASAAESGNLPASTIQSTSAGTQIGQYNFSANSDSQPGTVNVSWADNGSANQYNIVYGAQPNQLFWGAYSVPFSKNTGNNFTIGALNPGQNYYMELVAVNNGVSSNFGPIKVAAKSGTIINSTLTVTSGPTGQFSLSVQPGPTAGSVKVSWIADKNADQYNINYGPSPYTNFFGSFNVPFTPGVANSTILRGLNSGGNYSFQIVAEKNGTVIYKSDPTSTSAK